MSRQVCPPRIVGRLFVTVVMVLFAGTPLLAQNSAPTVSITYPADGASVSGQVYITLNSAFSLPLSGLEKQQIFVDGSLLWSKTGASLVPSVLWNTANVTSGTHSITATATDAFGNSASSNPVTLIVSNGLGGADLVPPTAPANLSASAVSCDTVMLAWTPSSDLNGSGVKSYTLYRNSYPFGSISLGATRAQFNDTDAVRSSATYSYYLTAQDFAGNTSPASNTLTVTTPACSLVSGEEVLDVTDAQPSGKVIATYGSREAFVYQKLNPLTGRYDSYLQVRDDNGARSRFLLHADEYETDYILTNSTSFWTISKSGGNVTVNQYQLNGSPIPNSATLISSQAFGDSNSCPKSLFRLKSGNVLGVWTSDCADYGSSSYIQLNIAYWNAAGNYWAAPLSVNLYPDTWKERVAIAQHPADGSIWIFNAEDTGARIGASHLTESSSGVNLDWSNPWYIASRSYTGNIQDGVNGSADEFPYLVAASDAARNTIDLAYQGNGNQWVYVDPLFQNGNSIFLKQNPIVVAYISRDGSRAFNTSAIFVERTAYFGFSVLSDGSLWLAYLPVSSQNLTWNRVYSSQYSNGSWSQPTFVGSDMNAIYDWDNSGPRWDPGFLILRSDRPEVAFRSADGRVHAYDLTGAQVAADTVPPSAPTNLTATNISSSSLVLSWNASTDNVGVAGYRIYRCLGAGCTPILIGTTPSTTIQDPALASGTTYTYAVAAYDTSNNLSSSSAWIPVTTQPATTPLTVAITNPSNGAKLRNSVVTVNALASDSVTVSRMELYIDGVLKSQASGSSLSYRWSTNKLGAGPHSIMSRAYDTSGRAGTGSITVYK